MTTVHASSPDDALRRLETMALMGGVDLPHAAVREQLRSAVDVVVHIARSADGERKVRFVDGRARTGLRPLDRRLLRDLREERCGSGS
jgi:pilus assembly protein CpaF